MTSVTTTTPLASSNRSGRLKYASAQDLPSFPSIGLRNDGAAASAAATLGWANQKSPELWKPDSTSTSASTAALLANDKMAPASDPQRVQSAAVSQAALMAAGSARRRDNSQSTPPSLWGSSAANLAFNAGKSPQQASPTLQSSALTRQNSMRAAKGAMAGLRPRATSSPMPPSHSYPDRANAASNALSAATHAHRPSMRTMDIPIEEAGAVPFTTMDRQMFTSRPPVKPEVDEQRRNDVLHASAVAMAKRMYNQQQEQQKKAVRNAETQARASSFSRHGEGRTRDLSDEEPTPIVYGNLQEAAYRLAQERLAKLQDEHQKNRDLQQYYGAAGPQRHGKLGTIRNKLTRRRSSSDGDLMLEDQVRSRQIRNQMSLFNTKLMEVDEQKRAKDREALLAAAQRNVRARLQDMDKKIQQETGMATTSGHGHSQSEWEWKAQAAAQARYDAAQDPNYGKIDLGGGKFMDKEEVDQIAAKKVQPLLDEINKNAELEYERRMQQKADEERRRDEEEGAKAREREIQAIHKKLKDQEKADEKARKAEIKEIERNQKEQAKAAKAEQKRLAKDGKGKEKEAVILPPASREGDDGHGGVGETVVHPAAKTEKNDDAPSDPTTEWPEKMIKDKSEKKPETTSGSGSGGGLGRAISIKFHKAQKHKESKGKDKEAITRSVPAPINVAPVAAGDPKGHESETMASPSSPRSPTTNKVKTWIKSHFRNQSRSKSSPPAGEEDGELTSPSSSPKDDTKKGEAKKDTRFIGGAALARLSAGSSGSDDAAAVEGTKRAPVTSPVLARRDSLAEEIEPHRDSLREVALAGRVDYLTDPDRTRGDEKVESSRPARGGSSTGVPIPPPAPVPVPIPVVITASEVSAQPQTATIVNTASYSSSTTRADKPLNEDEVSAESTDQEDEGEEKSELKIYSPVPLRLKKEEMSAVEKFGTTDWDTSPRTVKSKERGRGLARTGSVSSLSSTDLEDEVDADDEKDERYSLEKFEETRDKLDRPRLPPRVSSADVLGVVDDVSVDLRDEDLGGNSMLGRPRPVSRGLSPYRGSRFSEDL